MNAKVLIFGLGFQGKKYVEYFKNKGFIIDGVTNSGLNKNNILGISELYSYNQIIDKNKDFYKSYDIIIISIKPYKNQEEVIKHLLLLNIQNKIIIEKPVCYNIDLLNKLIKEDNYSFFIDEIILNKIYNKIFIDFNNFYIKLYSCYKDDFFNVLEHSLGGFLLSKKFYELLNNSKILFDYNIKNKNYLKYKIKNNFNTVDSVKMNFFLNKKIFFILSFQKALNEVLNLDLYSNKLIKINFYMLRLYFLNNNLSSYKSLNKLSTYGIIYTSLSDIPQNKYIDFIFFENNIVIGESHSYLSSGLDVLYAGQLFFLDGKVVNWNNSSGHYKVSSFDKLNREKFINAFIKIYGYDISDKFIPYPISLIINEKV